jgi:hypothetical protein
VTKKNLPEKTSTVDAVAGWMLKQLEEQGGVLHQGQAAAEIADHFGERFVYENNSGNACINKQVLAAFRELTGNSVVWISGERLWRRRELGDEPSRKQE